MQNFRLLSYYEEDKLSYDEKINYYKSLKEFLQSIDTPIAKKIYLDFCNVMNKKIVRNIIEKVKGYDLIIENQNLIPNKPVIFASSHQDFHDHFNVVLSIPYHAIILNNVNVSKIVKIALGINGIEYVDRDNPASRFTSKMDLMEYLSKGKSIVIFPEGTYNCSPNKLILPFHSGVIDISKKMQVPIVPMIQEYFYENLEMNQKGKIEKCIVRFGQPINVGYSDNISSKKEELKEAFSTLRYNIIENKGIYKRSEISEQEYTNYLVSKLKTFESVNSSYEQECNSIYGVNDYFYTMFPINAVNVTKTKKLLKTQ